MAEPILKSEIDEKEWLPPCRCVRKIDVLWSNPLRSPNLASRRVWH